MRIGKRFLSAALVGSLAFAGVSVANAEELSSNLSQGQTSNNISSEINKEAAITLLAIAEKIPEDVLFQGDESTRQWVSNNLLATFPFDVNGIYKKRDYLACAGAITALIGGTLIPAAKLLKIKRLVKELGGLKEAVKLMWGAGLKEEKLKELGAAATALGAELIGIAAVRDACADE